jgi:hypothetical protein
MNPVFALRGIHRQGVIASGTALHIVDVFFSPLGRYSCFHHGKIERRYEKENIPTTYEEVPFDGAVDNGNEDEASYPSSDRSG